MAAGLSLGAFSTEAEEMMNNERRGGVRKLSCKTTGTPGEVD